jgi:hypothetical protein
MILIERGQLGDDHHFDPEEELIVDGQLRLGRYRTPEDVIADALLA